jgi:hypothetical protein
LHHQILHTHSHLKHSAQCTLHTNISNMLQSAHTLHTHFSYAVQYSHQLPSHPSPLLYSPSETHRTMTPTSTHLTNHSITTETCSSHATRPINYRSTPRAEYEVKCTPSLVEVI